MPNFTLNEINKIVISAYDGIADLYANAYSNNDETDFKYFDCFINNIKGNKILDMGCGTGTNTNFFKEHGFDVIGIDASERMLVNAKKLYPNVVFEKQNIIKTSYPDNSFDGIILTYVIEHFNEEGLIKLQEEISRILCDGGFLFIASHEQTGEEIIADPLDENIAIYYNFITNDKIDSIFLNFERVSCDSRASYGPEEFLCDKMFITYKKR